MGKGDRRLTAKERTKLRAGAAVPTKPGKRKDNGRLSEAAGARYRKPTAPPPIFDARRRHLGLSEADAGRQEAGTGHGLLYLAGVISREGYDVAERYRRLRAAYVTIIRGPKEWGAVDLPTSSEYQGGRQDQRASGAPSAAIETPDERDHRIRREWEAVDAALAFRGPAARVLNDVAVRDEDIRRDDHDVRWFLAGLEALAVLWGHDLNAMRPQD